MKAQGVEDKSIGLKTKRYSSVIKAIFEEYPDVSVEIEGKETTSPIEEWCTNRNLLGIRNFAIFKDGEVLLSYHDHPREMIANISYLPLITKLYERRLLRYRILTPDSGGSILYKLWCIIIMAALFGGIVILLKFILGFIFD